MTNNRFLLEEQITVVSTSTLHEIFKTKYGADAIALYMFYYYTAKWQKTNQPRATNNFCMKGLNWGKARFKRAKKILRDCDLIEDISIKDKEGKISGWYIKIKYLWGNEAIKKIKPTPPENPSGGKQPTNALSNNKNKCLKENNINEQEKKLSIKKYSSIKDLTEKDYIEIAEKYKIPLAFVKLQREKMENWLEAKGRRYKNYKRALMNWVLKAAEDKMIGGDWNDKKRAIDATGL